MVELHIQQVWPLHGLPLRHNADRGAQFTAPYMRNLYKSLGVDQRLSTAYHPESQGQVKSNNKWLETYLRIFSVYQQDDWADFLHTAEFAYNHHHHPSIGTTPFYANYRSRQDLSSQLRIASGWSPTTSARMPHPRNSLLDGWVRTRYLRRLEPDRTGWISPLPGGYTIYSMRVTIPH